MPRVRVLGSDYKAAFESAKQIISGGMLSDEMGDCFIDNDGCIHNGANVFEYIENSSLGELARESDFKLEEDGASWFSGFRKMAAGNLDESEVSSAHLWEEFLTDLSRKYHDKYFLVACKKTASAGDSANEDAMFELYQNYAQNIMHCFYPQINDWEFAKAAGKSEYDDIYGLSLRLQIGTGGEKEIPILGTLYFKRHGNYKMIPLSAEDALKIEGNLESMDDKNTESTHAAMDVDATNNTLNTLFSELTRIINEDKLGDHLVGCLRFDESDKASLDSLLTRIQNDNKVLVCKQVEILGISHVNWERYTYTISNKRDGSDMFSIVGGIDGKVVMCCLGCKNNSDLILGNRVTVTDPETGEFSAFVINPEREDLGLTDRDFEKINKSRHFSSHYMSIGAACGTPRDGKTCSRMLCRSYLISVETAGGVVEFCRDCPYPEVIYKDSEGTAHYTPTLRFDTESMKLVTGNNISERPCQCCGRYVGNLQADMFCKLCATAARPDGAATRTAMINYEKYKTLLPLHTRIASVSKQKLCFEDTEILVFVIGEKKYVFHKFWLDSDGYSKCPDDNPFA